MRPGRGLRRSRKRAGLCEAGSAKLGVRLGDNLGGVRVEATERPLLRLGRLELDAGLRVRRQPALGEKMPEDDTIRPFTVGFPETELTDLRSRVNATRWPEVETVAYDSQ